MIGERDSAGHNSPRDVPPVFPRLRNSLCNSAWSVRDGMNYCAVAIEVPAAFFPVSEETEETRRRMGKSFVLEPWQNKTRNPHSRLRWASGNARLKKRSPPWASSTRLVVAADERAGGGHTRHPSDTLDRVAILTFVGGISDRSLTGSVHTAVNGVRCYRAILSYRLAFDIRIPSLISIAKEP